MSDGEVRVSIYLKEDGDWGLMVVPESEKLFHDETFIVDRDLVDRVRSASCVWDQLQDTLERIKYSHPRLSRFH